MFDNSPADDAACMLLCPSGSAYTTVGGVCFSRELLVCFLQVMLTICVTLTNSIMLAGTISARSELSGGAPDSVLFFLF